MRSLALLALAACSSAPPVHREPAPPPPPPLASAAPDAAPEPDDPDAERLCRRRAWSSCLEAARALAAREDPTAEAQGAELYRRLCTEGDHRGCFEPDTAPDLRATCTASGFVAACRELGALHENGRATCAYDTACAFDLYRMACTAGDADACTAATRVDAARATNLR